MKHEEESAMKLPSDRRILQHIFDKYQKEFADEGSAKNRASKIHVPINCKEIAHELGTDGDIIFGRLYYHLNKKYGYEHKDGVKVHLFAPRIAGDRHCVNFPLMSSVLAGLQEEKQRHFMSQGLAIAALVVSAASFGVSLWGATKPNAEANSTSQGALSAQPDLRNSPEKKDSQRSP